MKRTLIIVAILGLIIAGSILVKSRLDQVATNIKEMAMEKELESHQAKVKQELAQQERLKTKADSALLFAKKNGFDIDHAFLIDFSIHSGKNRFFVWDFKAKGVAFSSICAHGTGKDKNKSTYTNIKYSNVEGSLCSSLGKYKTGDRSYSNYGINVHYKLHGLDKTNSNAFKRIIVLHSHSPVPKEEIFPKHLLLGYSHGCPVVDNYTMQKIDEMLQKKDKPVLLWIYD